MQTSELRTITEGVAGSLGRGVQEEAQFIDFLAPDEVLRYSVCGLATAALQRYLQEHHNVRTTRIIINLPNTSPSLQSRHVFLRHNASITIDPTYSQFFEYAGLSVIETVESPELTRLYPKERVAVVEDGNAEQFIAQLAIRAHKAAEEAHGKADRSIELLRYLYTAIWKPETAKRFPASDDPMVDRIVEKMSEAT